MELFCQRVRITKAFKGKGEVLRLARQAGSWMEEIADEMRALAQASKAVPGTSFHYLTLHRRPLRRGAACFLRWRGPLHGHVRWDEVVRDLRQLPLGLHDMYLAMNIRARELNALHALYHLEGVTLERLAQVYGDEGEGRVNSPVKRCAGAEWSRGDAHDGKEGHT